MTRERSATQELEDVLALLDTVEQASTAAMADAAGPPTRGKRRRDDNALANGLFEAVRVDGEDELRRADGEEKIAILRRKVRALEDRLQDIRVAWSARDAELDAANESAEQEKRLRHEAEARTQKLHDFLAQKKEEIGTYFTRVQEMMREQQQREEAIVREQKQRQETIAREQKQREAAIAHEQRQREEALLRDQAAREREALRVHALREQEMTQEQALREETLRQELARRDQALRALTARLEQEKLEREKLGQAPPPPPPLLSDDDIAELTRALTSAARAINDLLKGRVRNSDEAVETLREAMRQLKAGHAVLAEATHDIP